MVLDARFGTSISKPRPPAALFCGGPLDSYTGYGQSGPMYRHCVDVMWTAATPTTEKRPLVLTLVRVISFLVLVHSSRTRASHHW